MFDQPQPTKISDLTQKQLMNCGKSCKKPRTNFASRTMKDQDLLIVEQRNKP
jgi:hypothetical protein